MKLQLTLLCLPRNVTATMKTIFVASAVYILHFEMLFFGVVVPKFVLGVHAELRPIYTMQLFMQLVA